MMGMVGEFGDCFNWRIFWEHRIVQSCETMQKIKKRLYKTDLRQGPKNCLLLFIGKLQTGIKITLPIFRLVEKRSYKQISLKVELWQITWKLDPVPRFGKLISILFCC